MKKIVIFLLIAVSLVTMLLFPVGCSCSKYSSYGDFEKNGTYKEKDQFYDWWSRNR